MKNALTLLLSSAGRRVELLGAFRASAAVLGLDLRLLAADLAPRQSPACHHADAAFAVPRCTEAAFVPAMQQLCQQEAVDLIVPTIDPELLPLSEAAESLARQGTHVAISAPEAVRSARDKHRTMVCLAEAGVPVPPTCTLAALRADPQRLPWPVVLKPHDGSSSAGVVCVANPEALPPLDLPGHYLAQTRLRGQEYTVNAFADAQGQVLCAVPHARLEVRSGEVAKGQTRRVPALERLAPRVAAALPGLRGPFCFQAFVDESGAPTVFEVNARFGGGYPLAHRAGAVFTQWLLEAAAGRPVMAHNRWQPGVTMLRYDQSVFLEDGA